ncbi:hypothetical protein [Actinomadura physcomitrii]|uniref:hypothetical protein n=1 Tax=Actinomadura physcomitrii TaxID=2650748 RepID=UPI001372086E|nr:hypothetical protein [Actinomadura physcomitrii]
MTTFPVARSFSMWRRLVRWLDDHGHGEPPADLRADFSGPALIEDGCADVTEVYTSSGPGCAATGDPCTSSSAPTTRSPLKGRPCWTRSRTSP